MKERSDSTMIKHKAKIVDARYRQLNGGSTPKEMVLDVTYTQEDRDGCFESYSQITVPVPFDTVLGDHPELIGKHLKIETND